MTSHNALTANSSLTRTRNMYQKSPTTKNSISGEKLNDK